MESPTATSSITNCTLEEHKPSLNKAEPSSLASQFENILQRNIESGYKPRRLGVTWNNLTVKAKSTEATVNENVFSQLNIFSRLQQHRQGIPLKTILHQSHGCVKPGEMLLVLGRPGSGCTTLLKMLANRRAGYEEVEGDVWYGSMRHDEAAENYSGQIVMNTEEEIFFPTLTVGQTMDFATRLKVPSHLPSDLESGDAYRADMKKFLLESLRISHTAETKVGNEYVRGVSGGERKRVSILECLASGASVYCWDNSTRGLDAASALDWAKMMRAMADVHGSSIIVTLYQAGNDIFRLFDKVLVLDEGKQIYYGPGSQAQRFMEELGFQCSDGANIGDYLTSVTVPSERRICSGYESIFPRNAEAILLSYWNSPLQTRMASEYDYPASEVAQKQTKDFKDSVALEKHHPRSITTVDFAAQVRACIIRQYQVLLGDKKTFAMKQGSTLIQALVAGSLYYQVDTDTSGLFLKSGALFWSILYNSMSAMSEVVDSFSGRPMVVKHKAFAYCKPAAFCIGQLAADIPITIFQISIWSLILYFMVDLKMSSGAFFTYFIVLFACAMCSTALFRAVGAIFRTFDGASKVSGYVVTIMAMYAGYQIQYVQMHPWFGWLYWLNPVAYAFDALMSNEFRGQDISCTGGNLIPHGESYANVSTAHQSCAGVRGAVPGFASLTGEQYLGALSYSDTHIWRNFGILWAWWIFYVTLTVGATMLWKSPSESGAQLLIPREKLAHHLRRGADDEESQAVEKGFSSPKDQEQSDGSKPLATPTNEAQLVKNTSIFTWKNLTYTVKTPCGPRVLLDNIQGWVKPGMLGALMGASGAGKTTLLDVLAQRKTEGKIEGSIMVDGRPLPISFQRSAGYCEQLDVHEPYATVREALEFSALLRQPPDTSENEKLRYVDIIIDLLELGDIADTLIGKPNAGGLNVEQRKRVTIGVELVAKPSILIFLDEPTSGLDGQSAFNTMRFLRKLASQGQAILVTIHQPSAQLFYQFDTLLLLAPGGKTVYFGEIGQNAHTLKEYFERYGSPCPSHMNPADHMIDVVSGRASGVDWHRVWLGSPEYQQSMIELDKLIRDSASKEPMTKSSYDESEYATSLWYQTKVVLRRMNIALFRNTNYVNNKIYLHIGLALFNGFSYWMIGDSVNDMQLRMFTIFVFMFVAPGVVNQLQPLFIERRDIYDAREKKSRMYSWKAFVTALIVSEFPYLCVCGVLYFLCWYYTVGFPTASDKAGAALFVVVLYEFYYTGIGQFIAAYSPNAVFAALVNPLLVGIIVSFCGILVPYDQIIPFWRYWMYYLNPTTYLVGSLLVFNMFDVNVKCTDSEFAIFDPPSDMTCLEYVSAYLGESDANLVNPEARSECRVCPYTSGDGYLKTLNLNDYYFGWRDVGIFVIFIFSSYGLVYLFMKLRTKASKKAE
ncbi:ABC-2 type transporter-domain-containing protein [Aspergillus alliaceus]|uniref:ABC-2 type transporter-domain-containing protein n=1 Tax=Petromyces alliaceus TaxID=209559 RepID=UPI0012A4EB85|nr:ABC-2 type transporter-domain-containing protein [Aspergillus alliaceus]KAB8228243.1 ABC-2 type transporter-domain-containing protein [Aspergillus alliaceus]